MRAWCTRLQPVARCWMQYCRMAVSPPPCIHWCEDGDMVQPNASASFASHLLHEHFVDKLRVCINAILPALPLKPACLLTALITASKRSISCTTGWRRRFWGLACSTICPGCLLLPTLPAVAMGTSHAVADTMKDEQLHMLLPRMLACFNVTIVS